ATCQEGVDGFEAGIKAATHLWNPMSPFHHRDVGLPGAVFTHPKAVASIIVDGVHVDFAAVKLSKQLMGERLFLITDAVATCNKGIYRHRLEGDHYVLEDGTLSGSALSLLKAVKNCIEKVDISLDEAIRMATLYPTRLIGRDDIGSFRIGAKANILVFNADFEVESVNVEGSRVVYDLIGWISKVKTSSLMIRKSVVLHSMNLRVLKSTIACVLIVSTALFSCASRKQKRNAKELKSPEVEIVKSEGLKVTEQPAAVVPSIDTKPLAV